MRGKSGPKPGQSCMRDPTLRKARALIIIEKRIHNMSNTAIGNELGVTAQTVANEIDWAKRQGIVVGYEEQILRDLVPAALKTVLDLIGAESTGAQVRADLAKEVLKGVGLLRKPSDRSTYTEPAAAEAADESLEMYIRKTVRGGTSNAKQLDHHPGAGRIADTHAPGGTLALLEGSVLADTDLGPAQLAPAVGVDRDEDRPADEDPHVELPADDSGS